MSLLLARARELENVAPRASPSPADLPLLVLDSLPLGVTSSLVHLRGAVSQLQEVQLFCELLRDSICEYRPPNCYDLVKDCICERSSIFHKGYPLWRSRAASSPLLQPFHPITKAQIISEAVIISSYISDLASVSASHAAVGTGVADEQVKEECTRFVSLIQRYGNNTARSILRRDGFQELWEMSMKQTGDSICGLDEQILSRWMGRDFYVMWYRRTQPVHSITYDTFRIMYVTSTALFASVTAEMWDAEDEAGETELEVVDTDESAGYSSESEISTVREGKEFCSD